MRCNVTILLLPKFRKTLLPLSLKTAAVRSSETSVYYHNTTWRHSTEDLDVSLSNVAARNKSDRKFTCAIGKSEYEGVSKSFRTGLLGRELQLVQLSDTWCSCIATLWVSLVSFYRHNPLCCFSTSVYFCLYRYRLSPETFGYTFVLWNRWLRFHPEDGEGMILRNVGRTLHDGKTQKISRWKITAAKTLKLSSLKRDLTQYLQANVEIIAKSGSRHSFQILSNSSLTIKLSHHVTLHNFNYEGVTKSFRTESITK